MICDCPPTRPTVIWPFWVGAAIGALIFALIVI